MSKKDQVLAKIREIEPTQEGQAKVLQEMLGELLLANATNWPSTFRSNMRRELEMMAVRLNRSAHSNQEGEAAKAHPAVCVCGCEAPRVIFTGFTQESFRRVRCFQCRRQGPIEETEEQAISAWNEMISRPETSLVT